MEIPRRSQAGDAVAAIVCVAVINMTHPLDKPPRKGHIYT